MQIPEEGIRIDVPFIETNHRRNVELTDCYIMLYVDYVEYKCVAKYEADDRYDFEGIWKEHTSNYRWTRRKCDLSQVDMYYDNPADQWMVSVEFSGISEPTGWLHDSPKKALALYTKLQEYMILR